MTPPLTWLIWFINGLLAVLYTLLDNVLILLLFPPLIWLAVTAVSEQRPWVAAMGVLVVISAFVVPAPIPLILVVMSWAGAIAIRTDRFNPIALRWRVNGSLALYALTAIGFTAYAAYASRLSLDTWSSVVSSGNAASVISQGRSFLNTIAIWGLWIIMPLGYLAILLQGVFVHPPTPKTPAEMIYTVRARGRDEEY
jgi:hypothetical protein